MAVEQTKPDILCVDDNIAITQALQTTIKRSGEFDWRGSLSSADGLVETCMRDCPMLVLLDVDMPGKNPFEALEELVRQCPQTRVVIFSGYVRRDLIERALDAGAWGYASKNDGDHELVEVLRRVILGGIALSSEAKRVFYS